VPKSGGAQLPSVETLPPQQTDPNTAEPTIVREEGGGSLGIVFVIIAIVLIV